MAYSADKGDELLELRMGPQNGIGPPMTFLLDGKQYRGARWSGTRSAAGLWRRGSVEPERSPAPFPKLMVFAVK